MIIADATRKIRVKLGGAVTTNELPITGWWVEQVAATGAWSDAQPIHAVTTGATAVDVVASPSSGSIRQLKGLSIVNKDTVSVTVTVELYDGANARAIWTSALAVGDSLQYDGQGSFAQFDNVGKLQTIVGVGSSFNDAEGDPASVGTAADGTSTYAARRDHVHGHGAQATDPFAAHTGNQLVGAASTTSQSVTTGVDTYLNLPDTEAYDTDSMHFTSSAALTGTVTKTAASTTITGSGTLFTTELSVGQMFSIPGTAVEYFVVTAIASNTSLTVSEAAVNTASGQTATRVNSAVVLRTAGKYVVLTKCRYDSNASGIRQLVILKKRTTGLANEKRAPVNGDSTDMSTFGTLQAVANDWVEARGTQTSGGTRNVTAAELIAIRIG